MQNQLEDNRFHNFGTYFRLMLGDFNYLDEMKVDYIFLFWVLFFISSIVLSIVLINLLIAIISNTFSKVSGSEKLTRNYELCNIMYQIDACEKQNEKEEKYLIHMYNDFHEKNENESEFNKIKYFIKRNKNLVKNVESLVIQNIKIHEDNNKKFNLFLDENKKKEN